MSTVSRFPGYPTLTIEFLAELTRYVEEQAEASTPGAYAKPASLGAKVEETSAKLDSGRVINGGLSVQLRGALKVKSGETLASGETLCTLPVALRPAAARVVACSSGVAGSTTTPNQLLIATSGVVTVAVAVTTAQEVFLDGVTYSIT